MTILFSKNISLFLTLSLFYIWISSPVIQEWHSGACSLDSRLRGNDRVGLWEWHGEALGMTWWSFGNGMVKLGEWQGRTLGMAWWSLGNDMVKLWEWHGEALGMAGWGLGNDMVKLWEWQGEAWGMTRWNLQQNVSIKGYIYPYLSFPRRRESIYLTLLFNLHFSILRIYSTLH